MYDRVSIRVVFATFAVALVLYGTTWADVVCCTAPDNGQGSAEVPTVGCDYESHELSPIIDVPGAVRLDGTFRVDSFFDITYAIDPATGGHTAAGRAYVLPHVLESSGNLRALGTIPVSFEVASGPRSPGQPVQSFDTDMFRLQGQLPPGDPDFDLLRITAGTGFGMPSPGHTTLTRLPGGDWNVDSFFDITYRIDFVGAPGGAYTGQSGSTTATIRLSTCAPILPDEGQNCFEVSPASSISFADDPIPAGFFDPGSEPFTGEIRLQGANPSGPDTVIQRLTPLDFGTGDVAQVEVEIVQLSLTSAEPIVVRYGDGTEEQWDLSVARTSGNCCRGHVIIMKREAAPGSGGGVFEGTLSLEPVLVFTRRGPLPVSRRLDKSTPLLMRIVEPSPWQPTPLKASSCDGNGFYPSTREHVLLASDPSPDPGPSLVLALEPERPVSPYFALDTHEQWTDALRRGTVRSIGAAGLEGYLAQWSDPSNQREGPPYPQTTPLPADLYVYPGGCIPCPWDPTTGPFIPEPLSPGLVMAWGGSSLPDGSYMSAWGYRYPDDPDLSNATVSTTVLPPCGLNVVSFGLRDANGNIRAWYWNVGPAAGPGTLACGVLTTISINGALTGIAATSPPAASYVNNPAFDITQVVELIVDENAQWVGGPVNVPPPGQVIPRPWNYWYDVVVTPNEGIVKPTDPIKWSQPVVECAPRVFLGWNELSAYHMPPIAADDWQCTDDRPVTDIHWWGSYIGWDKPVPPDVHPVAFHIAIWTDVPKNPKDFKSFSHPGKLVWEYVCTHYELNFSGYDKDPRRSAGDGTADVFQPLIHDSCFQYFCRIPQDRWFYQEPGPTGKNVYWLSIAAIYDFQFGDAKYPWGWKTRPHHFNDDAVRIRSVTPDATGADWPPSVGSGYLAGRPLEFPRWVSWDLAFELTTNKELVPGGGLTGDLDGDGTVDFRDFAVFAGQFLQTTLP